MKWLEKLRCTQAAVRETPELSIFFGCGAGMNATELEEVKRLFPFVDEHYLSCLRETGGLQVEMYLFFGSETGRYTSLAKGWRCWMPVVKDGGIPIGEDPSGNCLVLCRDGKIRLVSIYVDSVEEGEVLAQSFSEFLCDVLMGPQFSTLFRRGFKPANENEWTRFLRSQGWFAG